MIKSLIVLMLALNVPFHLVHAQNIRYYRQALPDEKKLFVGRFAVSEKDVPYLDACYRFTYNASGTNLLGVAYLERGKVSASFNALGAPELQFRYNAQFQLSEKITLDAEHRRTSHTKYIYRKSRLVEEQLYDGSGSLSMKIILTYDDAGRLVERAYRNAKNILQNNAAEYALQRFTYTRDGHLQSDTYYDAAMKVLRRNEFTYEAGNRVAHATYGSDGKLIEKQTFKYDGFGRVIETSDFDEYEQLKYTRRYTYNAQGQPIEQRFFNARGTLSEDSYGVAILEAFYDEAGNRRREVRYDALSRPIIDETYNEYGAPLLRKVIDEKGKSTSIIRTDYDKFGNRIKETTFTLDERQREVLKEERFFEKGSLVRQLFYDKNGKLQREVRR